MYWEMSTPASSPVTAADDDIVSRMLRGELTEEQAKEFARRDSECIAFTLLAVQQRLAQQQAHGPNTPSAAIPPYQKPAAKEAKTPKRKRGANVASTLGHLVCLVRRDSSTNSRVRATSRG